MGIRITGRQRDLLYDTVTVHLSGIADVLGAVEEERWEDAQRLSREYSDRLQLLSDGLGWGSARYEAVEITSPPEVLRRALEAIRRDAEIEHEEERNMRLLLAERQVERRDTLDACDE